MGNDHNRKLASAGADSALDWVSGTLRQKMGGDMKKDTMYSLRLSRRVRDALRKAAQRESRSMASLLNKIIIDYLQQEGFLLPSGLGQEKRLFPRRKVALPATYAYDSAKKSEHIPCIVNDLSISGVQITYPKGFMFMAPLQGELPQFQLILELPREDEKIRLDCVTCRMHDAGEDIQIGATFDGLSTENLKKLHTHLMYEERRATTGRVWEN